MCWYLDTFIWITVSGSHIQEVNTLFCTERYVYNKMSVGKDYFVYIYDTCCATVATYYESGGTLCIFSRMSINRHLGFVPMN